MTQEHPITPPPELVREWLGNYFGCVVNGELSDSEKYLATQAARWGADQELEALLVWLRVHHFDNLAKDLLVARRPKPPSLKEQALRALEEVDDTFDINDIHHEAIRRALESLPS